ncbi:MAG TPA: dihydroorotate dehydrogenase electron transfer subunit [Dehalococcoidia bacterium]|nr:dihydroorotate dehydrogenase electron transfer subunit [Dehalococcoidia bacterium]
MKQVAAEVISVEQILPGLKRPAARSIAGSWLIRLSCPEIAREARPGQFVMVRCGGELTLPRPFSIHQISGDGIALFFAVWEDGRGTNWLRQKKTGEAVEIFGPLGNGFSIQPSSKNLLLVAGGTGVAPLRFLGQEALGKGCSVTLLLGAATAAQLYPERLLPSLIKLVTATVDGTAGRKGMVTELMPDFAAQADQVFACGPMPMYRDMAAQKRKLRLIGKPVQISLEMRMGCGLGVCYGCTVKTRNGLKQVCKDGPVFELDDILWEELPKS